MNRVLLRRIPFVLTLAVVVLFSVGVFAQEKGRQSAASSTTKRVSDAPAGHFQAFHDEMSEGDAAEKRAQWFYGQRAYPNAKIPPGVRDYSLRQVEKRLATQPNRGLT